MAWELSPRLPDRAIITSDSGSRANWFARDLKMRRGMKAALSGGLASMGAAEPYAIAAKYAHPERPVIALVGDGAMQMNNMAELIPVVLEVKTDPEVPPLPLHITLQQAKNFSIALAMGDPDEVGVIRGTARQVLKTILPGKD